MLCIFLMVLLSLKQGHVKVIIQTCTYLASLYTYWLTVNIVTVILSDYRSFALLFCL